MIKDYLYLTQYLGKYKGISHSQSINSFIFIKVSVEPLMLIIKKKKLLTTNTTSHSDFLYAHHVFRNDNIAVKHMHLVCLGELVVEEFNI